MTGAQRPIEKCSTFEKRVLTIPWLDEDMFASRLRVPSNTYNPLRASHRNASTSP
jgi:hypothetical protein